MGEFVHRSDALEILARCPIARKAGSFQVLPLGALDRRFRERPPGPPCTQSFPATFRSKQRRVVIEKMAEEQKMDLADAVAPAAAGGEAAAAPAGLRL